MGDVISYEYIKVALPKEIEGSLKSPDKNNADRRILKLDFNDIEDKPVEYTEIKFSKDIVNLEEDDDNRQRLKGRIFGIDFYGKYSTEKEITLPIDKEDRDGYIDDLDNSYKNDKEGYKNLSDKLKDLQNLIESLDKLEEDRLLKNIDKIKKLEDRNLELENLDMKTLDEFNKNDKAFLEYLNMENEAYNKDYFEFLLFLAVLRNPDKKLYYGRDEFNKTYTRLSDIRKDDVINKFEGAIFKEDNNTEYIKVIFHRNISIDIAIFEGGKYYTTHLGRLGRDIRYYAYSKENSKNTNRNIHNTSWSDTNSKHQRTMPLYKRSISKTMNSILL